MEKIDGKSMDIVNENIAKLKELFPDVFSEGKVDFEALEATLGEYVDAKEERYSFNWNGKAKARRIAQTPSTGTLRPAKEESKNWDTTENLYIEGDNLEVLKLLQKSYHKQVKMIYIDPPYNTGKDFVYKDNFKDNIKNYMEQTGQVDAQGNKLSTNSDASGRFHSNWLNMMYPRLKLARNLLKENGTIFISLDEGEVANLKKICDEIFGEDNFIECITWNKRIPKNDKGVGNIHEYILMYVKNSETKPVYSMRKDGLDDIYSLADELKKKEIPIDLAEKEIKKLYKKNAYDRGITLYNSFDKDYKLWGKINMSWPNANTFGPDYEVLHPVTKKPVKIPDRGWRWKKSTFEEAANLSNGVYQNIEKLHDGSMLCGRIWFSSSDDMQPSSVTYLDEVNEFLLRSILSFKSDGGIEVEKIFDGKSFFSYPKPTVLLKILFGSMPSQTGEIYLDFFSGSSTTADALMQLNEEDQVNRKYIMVQLPEETNEKSEAYKAGYKNICEIGKERIRRAGEKIIADNPDKDLSDLDIGFKVFKLDSSNIKAWDPESDNLEQSLFEAVNNIKSGRTEEDLLYEILLKYGLDLTLPIEELELAGKKVYVVGLGALVICLDEQITLDTMEEIAKLKEQYESDDLMRVVFRDNGFKDAEVKTNAIQILKQSGIDDVKSL